MIINLYLQALALPSSRTLLLLMQTTTYFDRSEGHWQNLQGFLDPELGVKDGARYLAIGVSP